jgi:hypothetical protein
MIKRGAVKAGLFVLFLIFLEGVSSSVYAAYSLLFPHEAHRTLSGPSVQYDRELGWVPVPGFYDSSYYAPGVPLKINSQGFRADQDYRKAVPSGKIRVVCSGDSQGFGDGVGNDHTWCQLLASLDPRIQPVNMSETGYGLDQMYLWYRRNSSVLDHDIHLLAVIADDFRRMKYPVMWGVGKPLLEVQQGELTEINIPVPPPSGTRRWLSLQPNPLRTFRSVAVLADLATALAGGKTMSENGPSREVAALSAKIFQSLQAIDRRKGSTLVVVFLPTRDTDYAPGGTSDLWRGFLRHELGALGIPFVDVVNDDYHQLPVTMKDGMFIWPGSVHFFAEAPGHFNDEGHDYLARSIYAQLLAIPEVAGKLHRSTTRRVQLDATSSVAESR